MTCPPWLILRGRPIFIFFTDLLVWYSTCSLHFGAVPFLLLAYLSAWSIILPVCSGFSNWALFPLFRYIRYFLSSRALVCFITMRTWCVGREECSDCSWLYCTILYSIYYLIYNKPLLAQSLFRHITMAHLSLGIHYSGAFYFAAQCGHPAANQLPPFVPCDSLVVVTGVASDHRPVEPRGLPP